MTRRDEKRTKPVPRAAAAYGRQLNISQVLSLRSPISCIQDKKNQGTSSFSFLRRFSFDHFQLPAIGRGSSRNRFCPFFVSSSHFLCPFFLLLTFTVMVASIVVAQHQYALALAFLGIVEHCSALFSITQHCSAVLRIAQYCSALSGFLALPSILSIPSISVNSTFTGSVGVNSMFSLVFTNTGLTPNTNLVFIRI